MTGPVTRVGLEPGLAVRVLDDPYTSVIALACAGIRDERARHDSEPARMLRTLPEPQVRALALIAAEDGSLAPDCLTPGMRNGSTRVPDELDRLRSLSESELHDDMTRTFGARVPQRWAELDGALRHWARELTAGLSCLWDLAEPTWRKQDGLRGREAEQCAVAAARGLLDVALADRLRGGRADDGWLEFPDPDATLATSGGRNVVLSPLLSGLGLSLCNLDRPDALWFAAPAAAVPADSDGLTALLTPARARLLDALSAERSMTDVARFLNVVPASATHQVNALEAAGLVRRRRAGRSVRVGRTPRGDALLDLYGLTASCP